VVSTPQKLVEMIVGKAVKMCSMMDKKVLALVENMSYFKCPDCGKDLSVFGESRASEIASQFAIPKVARLPIDPEFASRIDLGMAEYVELEELSDLI
jgi:Mrp family chromosome partitioning ATPase